MPDPRVCLDPNRIIEKPKEKVSEAFSLENGNYHACPPSLFYPLRECSKLKLQSVSPSTSPDPFWTVTNYFPRPTLAVEPEKLTIPGQWE